MGEMQLMGEIWRENEIFVIHSVNLLLKKNEWALIINIKKKKDKIALLSQCFWN